MENVANMDFNQAVESMFQSHKTVISIDKVKNLLSKHQVDGKVSQENYNKVSQKILKACALATKSNTLSRKTSGDGVSEFSRLVSNRNNGSNSP